MNKPITDYEPQAVFQYFKTISEIPHGSFHTKAISDYCVQFAKDRQLTYYQDAANNVIIEKAAAAGYENAKPIILQGHLDMVCEKDDSSTHDFQQDPLQLTVSDTWLSANGTTLGGDDGIAIAYCLAILEDQSLAHPKLYCIFTADEEVGMLGAQAIDLAPASDAAAMINLDSEDEGVLLAGCAGGLRCVCRFPLNRISQNNLSCTLSVSHLHGGHSGQEINRFGANANTLLGTVLTELSSQIAFGLIDVAGGSAENVIPQKAVAKICIVPSDLEAFEQAIKDLELTYRRVYGSRDPELTITLETHSIDDCAVLTDTDKEKILFILSQIPNGVQSMSLELKGLTETSLNLGILSTESDELILNFALRSAVNAAKEALAKKIKNFTTYLGGSYEEASAYPAWEYKPDSELRETMCRVFETLYGNAPSVETIHAGLECGLIAGKLPHLDIVSIGPDMAAIHTPKEKLSIPSVKRTWDYLLSVLSHLN